MTDLRSPEKIEQCPVCGVFILEDIVKFSHGKEGTRARLFARVCQYAKNKKDCINKGDFEPEESDYYRPI